MDSSAPGIVTCVTQQDVLGSTGSVVLMERGTRIVGEYSSHMVQGQSRMFVLWNRAETPRHVVITLGSPAADAIGQAGFDGEIDTHFWAAIWRRAACSPSSMAPSAPRTLSPARAAARR